MLYMNKQWFSQLPIENIKNVKAVNGGDVNDAYQIEAEEQTYFLLVQAGRSKDFFAGEVAGLKDLREAGITVPKVYDYDEINSDAYLLISFLEQGSGNPKDLGKMIAKMHQAHSENGQFGYNYPHEGGDFKLSNEWTDSWIELFIERRLDVLQDEIIKSNKWSQDQAGRYQEARKIMVEELSNHQSQPSLLHGDLWGGNHMYLTDGQPALFDPSTFYGDREFDIGMSLGFGAFNQDFYDGYNEAYPLDEGADKRLDYYRLYLFMVHLHKFGGIYEQSVDQTLSDIISKAKK